MTARPTTIRLMTEACPHAVTLYEQGVAFDRRRFGVGTAAHDVLHAIGEGRDVDEVCVVLMASGREGLDAEGPLLPDAVAEGRQLAERWAEAHPIPDGALFEVGFGFGAGWQRTDYLDATWLRHRVDRISAGVEVDDEWGQTPVLYVDDYKTAWPAGEADLHSVQRMVALCCAAQSVDDLASHFELPGPVEAIVLRIHNLRTLQTHTRRVWLDNLDEVQRAQAMVELLVKAHDRTPRVAAPGPRCIGCDYVRTCEHAAAPTDDPVEGYAKARASAKALETDVRAMLGDSRRVETDDGCEVGYIESQRSVVVESAARALLDAWDPARPALSRDSVLGFIRAAGGLGVTQVRAVAKVLHPGKAGKAGRVALEGQCIDKVGTARWGVKVPK